MDFKKFCLFGSKPKEKYKQWLKTFVQDCLFTHCAPYYCCIMLKDFNITNIFNSRSHGWFYYYFYKNRMQNSQLNNLDMMFQFFSDPFSSSSCIVCSCTKLFLRCTQHLADVSQSKSSRSGLFMSLLRMLTQEILNIGEK